MSFGDDILELENTVPDKDYFNIEDCFDDQFGGDVQKSYRPRTSVDDDSDVSRLLDL